MKLSELNGKLVRIELHTEIYGNFVLFLEHETGVPLIDVEVGDLLDPLTGEPLEIE